MVSHKLFESIVSLIVVFIDVNKKFDGCIWRSLLKWSPYGPLIALSMALTGRCFEEVYKKPRGVVMKPKVV
jgi:hypothetical protein